MADNHNNSYVNSKGEKVPRVSELIAILGKDQIAVWANMLGFKRIDYKQELARAATIGTAIHDLIERYVDDTTLTENRPQDYGIHRGTKSYDEYCAALDSFLLWYDNLSVPYKVLTTEHQMVGSRFGGTVDCIIKGIEDKNKVIIVDYKTSAQFYVTMYLQLAAYAILHEELYGEGSVEGVMVVKMDKKKGTPADARLIRMDKLEPYIACMNFIVEVTSLYKPLEKGFKADWERIK